MWHKGDNYGTYSTVNYFQSCKDWEKKCLCRAAPKKTHHYCTSLSVSLIILRPLGAIFYCRTLEPRGKGLLNLICSSAPPISRCSGCPTAPHCEEVWTWQKGWRVPDTTYPPTPPSSSGASPGCTTQSCGLPQRWWSPSGSASHGRPAGLLSAVGQQRGQTRKILPPGCFY